MEQLVPFKTHSAVRPGLTRFVTSSRDITTIPLDSSRFVRSAVPLPPVFHAP